MYITGGGDYQKTTGDHETTPDATQPKPDSTLRSLPHTKLPRPRAPPVRASNSPSTCDIASEADGVRTNRRSREGTTTPRRREMEAEAEAEADVATRRRPAE